ncbi:hypothetical protein GCK32_022629 [Trichostrongylus colubriformis]|uniref:Uncharacterized protein n=1 Tax=Trichostrongylus colubriformis TaxID=6319 RepID=A0AAN8EW56_TRICO
MEWSPTVGPRSQFAPAATATKCAPARPWLQKHEPNETRSVCKTFDAIALQYDRGESHEFGGIVPFCHDTVARSPWSILQCGWVVRFTNGARHQSAACAGAQSINALFSK